ncbi:hypothetical protein AAFF_G00104330 [Aldrovandia affinis]|uniref:Uncharacterized protein n=1 Tax=Aldrovandia affinis TaxID=143900 RepID=A0AAD7T3N8_9TELE|nr:hypothetical protein AAFF_G00104330 [Aldrovandia affinis]
MSLLLLASIAALTTLGLPSTGQNERMPEYRQYCLRVQPEDQRDDTSQPSTTTPAVTTIKQGFPVRSRMDALSVYAALVGGIHQFTFFPDYQPGRLQLNCDEAVPLLVTPSGGVLIAAVQYGQGRVVVLCHEAYLQSKVNRPPFDRFVRNAIDWLKPHPDALVGVYKLSYLAKFLRAGGTRVRDVPRYNSTVGVFCCEAFYDGEAKELLEFVKGGGGLLIAGQAWLKAPGITSHCHCAPVSQRFPHMI